MRNIVLIPLTFLRKFLFDANLEGGIDEDSWYHGEDYILFLA